MAARLFDNGCLTPEQLNALAAKQIQQGNIVDTSCSSPALNTCERSFDDTILESPIYRVVEETFYKKWWEIAFPWNTDNLLSDERWGYAKYTVTYSYLQGDTATVIFDDGYLAVVYRALVDIPANAGVFNPLLWEKICEIRVSEPVGTLPYTELISRYPYYTPGSTYAINSIVLQDHLCGDVTCVYVATSTSTTDPGKPPSAYWHKLYCVKNNKQSKCENIKKCPPNYQVVSLSSGNNDLICVPVESNTGIAPWRN